MFGSAFNLEDKGTRGPEEFSFGTVILDETSACSGMTYRTSRKTYCAPLIKLTKFTLLNLLNLTLRNDT